MGKRTGRPPGRPPGSKDVRPLLLGLLQKYKLYPVLMAEFDAAKADMTPKERLLFSLELAKLGIAACPRSVSVDVAAPRMMVEGISAVPSVRPRPGLSVGGNGGSAFPIEGEQDRYRLVAGPRLVEDKDELG